MTGKHQGPWPRCATCGAPENAHPYRHPFKPRTLSRPERRPRG